MLFLIIILSISLSVDALGVGISYGLRTIKIPLLSKLVICMFSTTYATISILIGNLILKFLPLSFANAIGVIILIGMGLWVIIQSLTENKSPKLNISTPLFPKQQNVTKKLINIYIRPLKLTIQIIKDSTLGDIDNSKTIDIKESFYLGLALSIDSLGVGIGSCIAGINSYLVPLTIGLFQIFFLTIGTILGAKLSQFNKINKKVWFVFSGLLLIFLGIIRLIG